MKNACLVESFHFAVIRLWYSTDGRLEMERRNLYYYFDDAFKAYKRAYANWLDPDLNLALLLVGIRSHKIYFYHTSYNFMKLTLCNNGCSNDADCFSCPIGEGM